MSGYLIRLLALLALIFTGCAGAEGVWPAILVYHRFGETAVAINRHLRGSDSNFALADVSSG